MVIPDALGASNFGSNPNLPTMKRYIIKPIKEIIEIYPEITKNYPGNIPTILITTLKYDYNFKPTLILDFKDVFKDEEGFIEEKHIKKIKSLLPTLRKCFLIIVACDAALSRSPAVAAAIANYFNENVELRSIKWNHPYLNKDVYEFITEKLK